VTTIKVLDDIYAQNQFFNQVNAVWPDLWRQRAFVSPPRNGMDRRTGKLLQGWAHVEQSMEIIFETSYHERVLRRWVGSFIPRMLGESIVPRIITRFWWAIAEALELWEPNYRIKQIYFMGAALNNTWVPKVDDPVNTLVRQGQVIFRNEGVYRPRAHLGDFTPLELRYFGAVGQGSGLWDIIPVGNI
jgi:phage baseplate assembly protein W